MRRYMRDSALAVNILLLEMLVPAFAGPEGEPVEILVSRVREGRATMQTPAASLTDTYWKPIELNGQRVTVGIGRKELHLVLDSEGNRVRGYSGCNQFTGSYEVNGNRLRLLEMFSTMMACVEVMEQEQRFLKALGQVVRFQINGTTLALFDAEGQKILTFEAAQFR